jgi:hypothetical protein
MEFENEIIAMKLDVVQEVAGKKIFWDCIIILITY